MRIRILSLTGIYDNKTFNLILHVFCEMLRFDTLEFLIVVYANSKGQSIYLFIHTMLIVTFFKCSL